MSVQLPLTDNIIYTRLRTDVGIIGIRIRIIHLVLFYVFKKMNELYFLMVRPFLISKVTTFMCLKVLN